MALILGTTGGLVGGVLLATLLAGTTSPALAVIVIAVFLAFQANVAAYGVMVFWITIILGLLFGSSATLPSMCCCCAWRRWPSA